MVKKNLPLTITYRMENTKLKIRQMQADIQDGVLNEIEHVKNFLLIQPEDIELINQRLQSLSAIQ